MRLGAHPWFHMPVASQRPSCSADTTHGHGCRPRRTEPESHPPSAISAAPRSSLDAGRRIDPILDLDELVERVAYVFENDTDIDEFERALAALVRFAPLSDEARSRFAPLARRIAKVRKPVAQQLARMLEFLLTGNRAAADSTVDHAGTRRSRSCT